MKNLFEFDYTTQNLTHSNGRESKWSAIYGQGGNLVYCKKSGYNLVTTEDLSVLGNLFIDKGLHTNTYYYNHGETIGLNVELGGRKTVVGDKSYNAYIHVPNNGTGAGTLKIWENRLICSNGATRPTEIGLNKIIIPHNIKKEYAINKVAEILLAFEQLINKVEEQDSIMNAEILNEADILYSLNEWFFYNEYPVSQKAKDYTLDDFRRDLFHENVDFKAYFRYEQLMKSFEAEKTYNATLGLELSRYTLFATVTNFLSRKIEKSQSSACNEILYMRNESKLHDLLLA